LRRVRRLPPHRRGREQVDARRSLRAPEGRSALPGRALAQLQPQVLPALAPPLLLFRALERPAARRARLPARRVAADAARPGGEDARSCRALTRLAALLALLAVALPAAAVSSTPPRDWGRFGLDAARTNASTDATITSANVAKLKATRVH